MLSAHACVCVGWRLLSLQSAPFPHAWGCFLHACDFTRMAMHSTHKCTHLNMHALTMHEVLQTRHIVEGHWLQVSLCHSSHMAHFEQASLLATAWANHDTVKAMALQHSIVQVSSNKKLKRGKRLSCFVRVL